MPYKHYALRGVLIAALLPAISVGFTSSAKPALVEQTLGAIRDSMARSPAPWPEAWQQEYVDTIRHAITSHQDSPQYAVRLGQESDREKQERARPSIAGIRDKRLLRICDSGLKIKVLSKISRKQEKFDEI